VKPSLSVGAVSVATNIYIKYWESMAASADRYLFPNNRTTLYVFTDDPARAEAFARTLKRIHVVAIKVDPLNWPEATLLRYSLMVKSAHLLVDDVLMHIDADMELVNPVGPSLEATEWAGGLALVQHPGFRRPTGTGLAALYLSDPRLAVSDLRLWRRFRGLGAWEERPESLAFVPPDHRHTYVCGGVWLGTRSAVLHMSRELAGNVQADLDGGIVASWHDESHLNAYASLHAHSILDSSYCFVPSYGNLKDLEPRIRAIDKGIQRTR
jgi:hypothetical protein